MGNTIQAACNTQKVNIKDLTPQRANSHMTSCIKDGIKEFRGTPDQRNCAYRINVLKKGNKRGFQNKPNS